MKNLSWKKAAVQVLRAAGKPLHYAEITQRILDDGLKTTAGATPAEVDLLLVVRHPSRGRERQAGRFQWSC